MSRRSWSETKKLFRTKPKDTEPSIIAEKRQGKTGAKNEKDEEQLGPGLGLKMHIALVAE